jgi:hypothetical protein
MVVPLRENFTLKSCADTMWFLQGIGGAMMDDGDDERYDMALQFTGPF